MNTKKQAISEVGKEVIKTGTEKIKTSSANGSFQIGGVDFGKFAVAFKEEIQKDLSGSVSKKSSSGTTPRSK